MNEILEKLDELEKVINESTLFTEFEKKKHAILSSTDLINLNKSLSNTENIYTKEYKELKAKYLTNEEVAAYMHLERQIYILTLEINKRLKTLIKGD